MADSCTGIALVGAPGSGKRSTTFALTTLSRRYARYPGLTTARAAPLDHQPAAERHLAEMRAWAQVVLEVVRDGAVLVYERERLDKIREAGQLPVVTVDAVSSVDALDRESPGWLHVHLWRPRAVALRRAGASPREFDRVTKELTRARERFAVSIDTDAVPVPAAAQLVHVLAQFTPELAPEPPLPASRAETPSELR
jgi:hypothetical protein